MNERTIQDDRDLSGEAAIQRRAEELNREHGLDIGGWECHDERHEELSTLVAAEDGMSEEQRAFLMACLQEIAPPAIEEGV